MSSDIVINLIKVNSPDTYANNIFSFNRPVLRNIVHCTQSYYNTRSSNLSKITDVTLSIHEGTVKQGKDFLREGMYFLSPDVNAPNQDNLNHFVTFNPGTSSYPYLSNVNLNEKRNKWTSSVLTEDIKKDVINNLVFYYDIEDDYREYKSYENLTGYCRDFNKEVSYPNREMFQQMAKQGVVDMCIAFPNYVTDIHTQFLTQNKDGSDNNGFYLYDGDDVTISADKKLVPSFKLFDYNNRNQNQNKNNFVWSIRYLGDNKFTIQNKYTGRYLKSFEYYGSTYLYVGDNSFKSHNSHSWFIQNIFPPTTSNNININIPYILLNEVIKNIRNTIKTEPDTFLQKEICGNSKTFIDGTIKLVEGETLGADQTKTTTKTSYSRLCLCNMNNDYYYGKNASYGNILKNIFMYDDCSEIESKNFPELDKNIDKIRLNNEIIRPVCSDDLCKVNGGLKDTSDMLASDMLVKHTNQPCVAKISCIQTASFIIAGSVTNSTITPQQAANCGATPENTVNITNVINYEPTLIYNLDSINSKELYQYTKNCYDSYMNQPLCTDTTSNSCQLNTDVCKNNKKVAAKFSTDGHTVVYDKINNIRTIEYTLENSVGLVGATPQKQNNRTLFLDKFIRSNREIIIRDDNYIDSNENRNITDDKTYAKFSFDANTNKVKLILKDKYRCPVPVAIDTIVQNNRKWARNYSYNSNNLNIPEYSTTIQFNNACPPLPPSINTPCKDSNVRFIGINQVADSILYNNAEFEIISFESADCDGPTPLAWKDNIKLYLGINLYDNSEEFIHDNNYKVLVKVNKNYTGTGTGTSGTGTGTVACPIGKVNDDGVCKVACPTGKVNDDSVCKVACPTGKVNDDGVCKVACPTGKVNDDGICKVACPTGKVNDDSVCKNACPAGKVNDDSVCKNACPAGKVNDNGICKVQETTGTGTGTTGTGTTGTGTGTSGTGTGTSGTTESSNNYMYIILGIILMIIIIVGIYKIKNI